MSAVIDDYQVTIEAVSPDYAPTDESEAITLQSLTIQSRVAWGPADNRQAQRYLLAYDVGRERARPTQLARGGEGAAIDIQPASAAIVRAQQAAAAFVEQRGLEIDVETLGDALNGAAMGADEWPDVREQVGGEQA